jgi:hypothetical protein
VANLPDPPRPADGAAAAASNQQQQQHRARLEAQLAAAFAPFGPVGGVRFPPSGSTRTAFVGLPSVAHAVAALLGTHNRASVMGRRLRVSFTTGSAATTR